MDAIGLSVGLAGASFDSNKGYTIFAGSFYAYNGSSSGLFTVTSASYENPIQGVMGWFSAYSTTTQSSASNYASGYFTSNIALNPKFISPNVYYSGADMTEMGSGSNGRLHLVYVPGTTTTINFTVYTTAGYYTALCCYFYIFF